jgi:hypothetical protein
MCAAVYRIFALVTEICYPWLLTSTMQASQLGGFFDRRHKWGVIGVVSFSTAGHRAHGWILGEAWARHAIRCREHWRSFERLHLLQCAVGQTEGVLEILVLQSGGSVLVIDAGRLPYRPRSRRHIPDLVKHTSCTLFDAASASSKHASSPPASK